MSTAPMSAATNRANEKQFLGHPVGLYVLFFTEMWERFSYYGMRALLMLYMLNFFKWTQEDASKIYKWYTALVYLTPLLGGFLADRFLGNKWAIVIGGVLMAIGQFTLTIPNAELFYVGLGFMIVGNGFFKPNMSAQVGRLYPANDTRRDAAYTIFYMGINLGAFLAPIVCGWLRVNTELSYRAGFAAAGVGMILGLVIYLFGLPWVREIAAEASVENTDGADTLPVNAEKGYVTERAAANVPSVIGGINRIAPTVLYFLAVLAVAAAGLGAYLEKLSIDNAVAVGLGGGFACMMGAYIASHVQNAVRDRVLAILAVSLFVIFFWAAFEQAGNTMNVHADQITNRYLTQDAPTPTPFPIADAGAAAAGAASILNPVPAEWFQSINALAIFVLAPLFAWLWVKLPTWGVNLSIPAKMILGVFLQGMAFALMVWAVKAENQPSSTALAALPAGVQVDKESVVVFRDAPDLGNQKGMEEFTATVREDDLEVVHGRRLKFMNGKLDMVGVLSDTDRDRMLRASVSAEWLGQVRELAKASTAAQKAAKDSESAVILSPVPAGFDLRYAGLPADKVSFDPTTGKLATKMELTDREHKQLLLAGADPAFRSALSELYVASARFKVSAAWLFWFYILSTIAELCLSPVGLSMVSKLAPAKFVTMLMGMWLLTSFFGNFLAGLGGESWGKVDPYLYFGTIAGLLIGAAILGVIFVRKVTAMMHGVR